MIGTWFCAAAELFEHPQAALLGQRDVEQHEIGPVRLDLADGGLAVADDLRAVALQPEVEGQPLGDGGVVLDDGHQRPGRRSRRSCRRAR